MGTYHVYMQIFVYTCTDIYIYVTFIYKVLHTFTYIAMHPTQDADGDDGDEEPPSFAKHFGRWAVPCSLHRCF